MADQTHYPAPPALPGSAVELIQGRVVHERSFNDVVEEYHLKLWDNELYRRYFFAVHRTQAVEHNLSHDICLAALMVRERAKKEGNILVATATTGDIARALGVVARRFGISRPQRLKLITNGHGNGHDAPVVDEPDEG